MSRAFIVWTSCAVFALLNVVGAHGHRLPPGHDPGTHSVAGHPHAHPMAHDHALDAPALSGTASDEHEHAEHGDIEVGAAKMSGKSQLAKLVPHLLADIGALILIERPAAPHWRLTPPDRTPGHRSHPFHLPPSHAPPLAA